MNHLSPLAEKDPATVARVDSRIAAVSLVTRGEQGCQAMLAVVVLAFPALLCVKAAGVIDPDIWWHLRTAEWMLAYHAVPHSDPFSAALDKPWAAYSWLFELLLFKLFRTFGLAGIVGYTAAMVLAISAAVFRLIRRVQPDFTLATLLTLTVSTSLLPLCTPRPWLCTILFFVLELDVVIAARRSGRVRDLLWLPPLFALWANVHIQFIDGLLVLGMVLAESVLRAWVPEVRTRLRPLPAAGVLAACLAATLLNPYGAHLYRVAFDLAAQPGVLGKVAELQAIPFRGLPDYALLLLALGAAAALGRARQFEPFEIMLFAFAAVISFRSERDVWVMAGTAAAILAPRISLGSASRMDPLRHCPPRLRRLGLPLAALAAGLLVLAGFRVFHVDQASLEEAVASAMPVAAADAIQKQQLAGPIFNDYNWGGYLMWKLRLPVSLDGRAALHGDQAIDRSVATWSGHPGWEFDPELSSAGTVVGPSGTPLSQLLRRDRRYRLVFEDQLACVFVRVGRQIEPSTPTPGKMR